MSGFPGLSFLGPKSKNAVVAGGLTAFVFVVYFYTMRAVGGTDELQMAIDKFEDQMMKLGPLGDSSGETWEELGGSDRISHIFVSFDNRHLKSIQFGYVKNGALVMSKKHGSSDSSSTRIVRLNHVSEFVTGISGECCRYGVITSLTFHTNERKHEAFRSIYASSFVERLTKREFHSGIHDRREFAGFFGSCSSSLLNSIGPCLKPILLSLSPSEVAIL